MSWRAESTFKPSSSLVEDEKEYMKLVKKIRDILKLEEKSANGEKLAQNQLDKISSKNGMLKEIAAVAIKLPGDTEALGKTQDILDLLPSSTQRDIEKKRQQQEQRKQNRQQKDEEERKKPIFMTRHDRPILDVCVSSDGKHLYTCSKDKYALCWSMADKLLKVVVTFGGHTGAVFALDVNPRWLITGSADGQVMFWEANPSRHSAGTVASAKRTIDHGGMVRVLRWCPFDSDKENRRFASASEKLGSTPAKIAVWEVSSAGAAAQLFAITDMPGKANDLQWGGGAKTKLFTSHDNGYVGVWLAEAPGSLLKTIKIHQGPISSLALSGTTLVTASHDRTAVALDVSQPTTPTLSTWKWNRPLNAVIVSDDFRAGEAGLVVVGGGKDARDVTRATDMQEDEFDARVFDSKTGEPLAAGTGHFGPIHALLPLPRVGPDGAFASVSEDGCLKVHGLDGELIHSDTLV